MTKFNLIEKAIAITIVLLLALFIGQAVKNAASDLLKSATDQKPKVTLAMRKDIGL